ncbi:MAG TPA: hypothetical protein VJS43_05705 [Candidatus Acidoferrales bacterium]|nr:hypothetical protein [Candidatus Acidoferrales bacterium]
MGVVLTDRAEVAQERDGRGSVQSGTRERTAEANRRLSDDEILGLGVRSRSRKATADNEYADLEDFATAASQESGDAAEQIRNADGQPKYDDPEGDGEEYRDVFEAKPELKRVWDQARAYREMFGTPEEAGAATKMVADLRAMDALFFSKRAEDKTELARLVAKLDADAFDALAKAMSDLAAERQTSRGADDAGEGQARPAENSADAARARREFLQAANADAVRGVLQAIEARVERVLPENVSKAARNRVVGEIYRDLDKSLQANPDFAKHVRSALRAGNFDAGHQNAVASLVVGRARQSLPSVAKRVLNEWTSTILAANQDRREKQRSAESRVDIAGAHGGKDAQRARSPRDIDYSRMSDADILNL